MPTYCKIVDGTKHSYEFTCLVANIPDTVGELVLGVIEERIKIKGGIGSLRRLRRLSQDRELVTDFSKQKPGAMYINWIPTENT